MVANDPGSRIRASLSYPAHECKRGKLKKSAYFELTNKYATTRENIKEWIKIIRARPVEKVKEDLRITTGNARENLKRWVICSACAC
jgi:hypothetical protein